MDHDTCIRLYLYPPAPSLNTQIMYVLHLLQLTIYSNTFYSIYSNIYSIIMVTVKPIPLYG